jgi:hypothetical protein
MDMYYALTLSNSMNMPDQACRLAVRLFESKGAQTVYRANAVATLARLGNKSHIPLLEKAMKDNTVLYTVQKNTVKDGKVEREVIAEIQIRDVSLAVSLILSGQKPEDYGFTDQFKANGSAATNYSYTRFYLTEEKRDAAMKKWAEWRAAEAKK